MNRRLTKQKNNSEIKIRDIFESEFEFIESDMKLISLLAVAVWVLSEGVMVSCSHGLYILLYSMKYYVIYFCSHMEVRHMMKI